MMTRSVFRPGKGATTSKFIAAYCNGTAVYRGDFVVWDTTAPTSQGSSGVVNGETLGATDFIYVTTSTTTAGSIGKGAGVVEGGGAIGTGIGNRNTTTAVGDDKIAICMTYGVFSTHCQCDTATAAGDLLLAASTVAGQLIDSAAPTSAVLTNSANDGAIAAFVMVTDATYTRATVTTTKGCTAFIRCDW